VNRFVAVADVDDIPTAVILDDTGPLIYKMPALASAIAAAAGVPADILPLIRVVCIADVVKNGPIILPVMLIVEVAPGVVMMYVVLLAKVEPVILIFTMLPLHAKTSAPEQVISLNMLYVFGPELILNTLFLLSGDVAVILPVKLIV